MNSFVKDLIAYRFTGIVEVIHAEVYTTKTIRMLGEHSIPELGNHLTINCTWSEL